MKTLENYFQQDVSLPEQGQAGELTGSERAFLEKYVGIGWENTPAGKALSRPVKAESVMAPMREPAPVEQAAAQQAPGNAPGPEAPAASAVAPVSAAAPGGSESLAKDATPAAVDADVSLQSAPSGEVLEAGLMSAEEIRLVSFHVADQLFAVPIMLVQEVLRAVPATKLPAAPPFLSGVTNLRGRVTPLVDLASLLGVARKTDAPDNFLIVCRLHDMQIGLQVRAIDTMYKPGQGDMEWNIEAKVGVGADLVSGLFKKDDQLIKILSVTRLFTKVLRS